LAVGLAVALAAVAAYFTVRHQVRAQLDSNLQQRANAAVNANLPDRLASSPAIPSAFLALGADLRIATVDSRGTVIYLADQPRPPVGSPEVAVARGAADESIRTARAPDGVSLRVVAVPARQPGLAFVLAESLADTNAQLRRMGLVMLLVGVVGIALSSAVGLAVARGGLRPVERLTATTEHITRTDELRPIPVSGTDELARLTASFNTMLEALSQSRERQRQLVADAGHELRTPLTSLRTNIDLLSQVAQADGAGMDPQEHAELLGDVRAQLAELTVLVGDLVELARPDSSAMAPPELVDLAAVVEHAVDRARRRAPGLDFDVRISPWSLYGDGRSLERAVMNLLDNAAKWSPPGGVVEVMLESGRLTVSDAGPGIADTDLPHVFERFYRAEDARSLPGSGLGLAIVHQAAERHGGHVWAERSPLGGARFVLQLPGGE
jgi:two-component system sensor histidine kinase MprB